MSTIITNLPAAERPAAVETKGLNGWVMPLTAMMFVLGGFVALALKTQNKVRNDNLPSSSYTGLAQAYWSLDKTIHADQATIGKQRDAIVRLTDSVANGDPQTSVLSDELKQAQLAAGLMAVVGPGVVVTLTDSKHPPSSTGSIVVPPTYLAPWLIHDIDIAKVVNELRASGGEAYAVNGQRIISTSAIRCVGPAIQVNGIPLEPPYKITAIGDPSGLYTALNMTGGIVSTYKDTDPAMISVQKVDKLQVPAYDGAVQFHFARPVSPTGGGKDSSGAGSV